MDFREGSSYTCATHTGILNEINRFRRQSFVWENETKCQQLPETLTVVRCAMIMSYSSAWFSALEALLQSPCYEEDQIICRKMVNVGCTSADNPQLSRYGSELSWEWIPSP